MLLAAKTRKGRQAQRRCLRLRDFTVTQKTRSRYESAVIKSFPSLKAVMTLQTWTGSFVTLWSYNGAVAKQLDT